MFDLPSEQLPVGSLTPYEKNAKKHPQEQVQQIVDSIREFGMNDPIAVWGPTNMIVEGHGRLLACKKLGIKTVPVIRLDHLTDEQRRAYALAHNKTTMNSDFDFDILTDELAGIVDIDMTAFGFDLSENEPGEVIEDEAPEVDEINPPTAKLGDIWQLGRHRLMCGDSTDAGTVALLMNSKLADMYLTDPYNVNYTGKTKDALKIDNDSMSDEIYKEFLGNAFSRAIEVMKPGAVFYIWHADSEGYNVRAACKESDMEVRQCLIWKKNSMVMGRQDYQWQHEPCLYGWKAGAAHLWASDRKQTTILEFDRPTKSAEHPTMKPVKLFDYQIQNNTKGKDIVYDGFAGSGTTIIACEQNGRIAYCVELDPRYCDVIIKRWETLTGEKAVLQS